MKPPVPDFSLNEDNRWTLKYDFRAWEKWIAPDDPGSGSSTDRNRNHPESEGVSPETNEKYEEMTQRLIAAQKDGTTSVLTELMRQMQEVLDDIPIRDNNNTDSGLDSEGDDIDEDNDDFEDSDVEEDSDDDEGDNDFPRHSGLLSNRENGCTLTVELAEVRSDMSEEEVAARTAAWKYTQANEKKIRNAVLKALFHYCQTWIAVNNKKVDSIGHNEELVQLDEIDDLRKLIVLERVCLLDVYKDGFAYIGYQFKSCIGEHC